MQALRLAYPCKAALAILAASLLAPGWAAAQREGALHNFGSGQDGNTVYGGVISDASGNLYGTTFAGGPYNNGVYGSGIVFELSPQKDGTWTETALHNFGAATDGWGPTAGLVLTLLAISTAQRNMEEETPFAPGDAGSSFNCGRRRCRVAPGQSRSSIASRKPTEETIRKGA